MKPLVFMFLSFSFFSCTLRDSEADPKLTSEPVSGKPITLFQCPKEEASVDFKAVRQLSNQMNQFAYDFFKEEAQHQSDNILFSPFGLETVFAMIYQGSATNAEAQLKKTFSFSENNEPFHSLMGNVLTTLNCGSHHEKKAELTVSNNVFLDKEFKVKEAFSESLQTDYHSQFASLDFKNDNKKALRIINETVKNETHGKIEKLFDHLDRNVVMVLINTLYLNAKWQHPFMHSTNKTADFTLLDNTTKSQEYMERVVDMPYFENENLQMAEIPYEDSDFGLFIILPKAGSYSTVEQEFQKTAVDQFVGDLKTYKVKLDLPKIKVRQRPKADLDLKALGLAPLFDESNPPDFSGISKAPLFISQVAQEAFMSFDEKGTVAVAATGVSMSLESMPQMPDFEKELFVNRPFLFQIVHKPSGFILFMGAVKNP